MYLIYGKNKVGQAVTMLCDHAGISYEMLDDGDVVTSFDRYEAIIPSPGVPGTHPIYSTGKVISELDFAYQFLPEGFRISAVTGTDGKSTTTWMLYSILQKEFSGKKSVYISGNFDVPFSATVLEILQKGEKRGEIVIEISSFMSYWIGKSHIKPFTPDYTIFTNLKTDHLNWHRDLQEYLDAKMNLAHHTLERVVLNQEVIDFAEEKGLHLELPENVRVFSSKNLTLQESNPPTKDWTDGEDIAISGRRKYKLSETKFSGLHNAMNLLSVTLVTNEMTICSKRTKKYLTEIEGLSHRLEKIGEKKGIIFVDDSKSTSAQSLGAALGAYMPVKSEKGKVKSDPTRHFEWSEAKGRIQIDPPQAQDDENASINKNLLLIVGGSDKGDTFVHLAPKFRERVKAMVCIGATKEQFVAIAKEEHIPYLATDALSEGVKWLYEQGSTGDVLILSPGCASFGLFRDYLDRANQFREAIKNLPE